MKISDFIFEYPSYAWRDRPVLCRVRIFVHGGEVTALLTDVGAKNTGPSVTNSVEHLITGLIVRGHVGEKANFIEHYENSFGGGGSFDQVTIEAKAPHWIGIAPEHVMHLTGCTSAELKEETLANPRLVADLERIRTRIEPYDEFPNGGGHQVIARRLAIEERMVSKQEVETLIASGAGEQEIQALLKRDLSLIAEAYAHPAENYIGFSEFPLGDGTVDFALFTGTSRMDVTLIEVKGADFYLVNADSYGEFAQRINQAAGQIRKRLGAVYRDYHAFRQQVHRIRARVEAGERLHNAFPGPHTLQVDPGKDVNLRTVIIGGRTRDDLAESAKRQDFERTFSLPIKIESWDTWLRKLRRR